MMESCVGGGGGGGGGGCVKIPNGISRLSIGKLTHFTLVNLYSGVFTERRRNATGSSFWESNYGKV